VVPFPETVPHSCVSVQGFTPLLGCWGRSSRREEKRTPRDGQLRTYTQGAREILQRGDSGKRGKFGSARIPGRVEGWRAEL